MIVVFTRPSVAQIQKAGGLAAYVAATKKSPKRPPPTAQPDCLPVHTSPGEGYDHVCGYLPVNLQGSYALTSIYAPSVQTTDNEGNPIDGHSLSELWTLTGTCVADPDFPQTCGSSNWVQSVEVGWIVGGPYEDPPYEDLNAHLFFYSTQDGYQQTGCWAGEIPAECVSADTFIEYSGAPYMPGMTVAAENSWTTPPEELRMQVVNGGGNAGYPKEWEVIIDDNYVGYYPGSSFTGQMQTSASLIQVGGEVFDAWPDGAHTSTVMGSGYYPGAGFENAAYSRNISWLKPYPAWTWSNAALDYMNGNGACGWDVNDYYGLSATAAPGGSGWGTYFYFGGNYTY
jgi:hypothetical protein